MKPVNSGRLAAGCVLAVVVNLSNSGGVLAAERAGLRASTVSRDGTTPLHVAVDHEDGPAVDRLIRARADVNAKTRLGITPLWLAATYGNAAIIGRLLEAGADARTMNPDNGETVLMMAARSGHADAVRVLLDHGADVNAAERLRNQTALMWAAAQKHPDVVRVLLERGAKADVSSSTALTPVLFAIRAGDITSTELLIGAGADIRTPYKDGTTPLVLAMLNAHYDLAAMLLARGVDPNAKDSNGSALHVLAWMRAARGQHMIQAIERVPSGRLDAVGLAEQLIAHGADVNARIDWKDMPIPPHAGSANGTGIAFPSKIAVTQFNYLSFVGATPFWLAAFYGDPSFMRFLVAHGADPLIPTRQSVTPLLAAAGVGYAFGGHSNDTEQVLEAVNVAYELGNDVHAIVDFGQYQAGDWRRNGANAMHGAAMRGNLELITWLADKGVALDRITEGGWHPVHCAEGVWVISVIQRNGPAAKLLRQLVAERGLLQPRARTSEEIQTDGLNRQVSR